MTVGMSLCLARRRPPTRRAIPAAKVVGRVNDFGGWYYTPRIDDVDPTIDKIRDISSRDGGTAAGCDHCDLRIRLEDRPARQAAGRGDAGVRSSRRTVEGQGTVSANSSAGIA
jgi:hypothetical protein